MFNKEVGNLQNNYAIRDDKGQDSIPKENAMVLLYELKYRREKKRERERIEEMETFYTFS